jgi:23S rRNA (cytidine2498-2'-O)-methyltransferase
MNRPKRPGSPARPGRKPESPRSTDKRRAKPERGSKPDRGAKTTRGGKPERAAKPERGGRPERGAKTERPAKPSRFAKPERAEKPERPAKPSRFAKPERGSNPERSAKPSRPGRPERGERDERGGRTSKPSRPTAGKAPAKEWNGLTRSGPPKAKRASKPKFEFAPPSAEISKIPLVRGEWLYTTRAGYEQDILEELRLAHRGEGARVIAPSLIASPKEYVDCAFARQAMPAKTIVKAENALALDRAVTVALRDAMRDHGDKKWALHVWFPDSEEGNKSARVADVLERTVPLQANALDLQWAARRVDSARVARDAGGILAQVCVLGPNRAIVSATPAVEAHSLHAGGRARMRVDSAAPSRAAMKLEEALDWFGAAPSAGDECVDLGAAPGGWTHVLLQRGAKVLAVDPGAMAPSLAKNKNLEHISGSAFEIEPKHPAAPNATSPTRPSKPR